MNWRPYEPSTALSPRRWRVPNQSWRETSNFRLIVHGAHAFQRLANTAPPDYEPVYGLRMPIWFRKRVLARVAVGSDQDDPHRSARPNRLFIMLLLIHFFLLLARAVPVSKDGQPLKVINMGETALDEQIFEEYLAETALIR
ncbi:hypothetical protein V8E52_003956 [Russula decolorans]